MRVGEIMSSLYARQAMWTLSTLQLCRWQCESRGLSVCTALQALCKTHADGLCLTTQQMTCRAALAKGRTVMLIWYATVTSGARRG